MSNKGRRFFLVKKELIMKKVKINLYKHYDLDVADEKIWLEIDENKILYFIKIAKQNNCNISIIFFEEE